MRVKSQAGNRLTADDLDGVGVKTYKYCYCHAKHRTYHTVGKCVWRRAGWVAGNGQWATVAHCRVLTVELHKTKDKAEAALAIINRTACGGFCHKRHELIRLDFPHLNE